MYEEHPSFEPLPDNAALWRYLDFTKFVSLLDKNALFFARADKLGDPFEGAFPEINILAMSLPQNDVPEDARLALGTFRREVRRFTLINCWHNNAHESAAMWRLYSREYDGVAIKTDFKSLTESLKGDQTVFVGKINYLDFETSFIDASNAFAPFLTKRVQFAHEQEVRAVYSDIPARDGAIDYSANPYEIGTYIDIDVRSLINEIVVAPYAEDWFVDLIGSVSAKYNIDAQVEKSSLTKEPTWI